MNISTDGGVLGVALYGLPPSIWEEHAASAKLPNLLGRPLPGQLLQSVPAAHITPIVAGEETPLDFVACAPFVYPCGIWLNDRLKTGEGAVDGYATLEGRGIITNFVLTPPLYGHVLTRFYRITEPRQVAVLRMQCANDMMDTIESITGSPAAVNTQADIGNIGIATSNSSASEDRDGSQLNIFGFLRSAEAADTNTHASNTTNSANSTSKSQSSAAPSPGNKVVPSQEQVYSRIEQAWEPVSLCIVTSEPWFDALRLALHQFDRALHPGQRLGLAHVRVLYRWLVGDALGRPVLGMDDPYDTADVDADADLLFGGADNNTNTDSDTSVAAVRTSDRHDAVGGLRLSADDAGADGGENGEGAGQGRAEVRACSADLRARLANLPGLQPVLVQRRAHTAVGQHQLQGGPLQSASASGSGSSEAANQLQGLNIPWATGTAGQTPRSSLTSNPVIVSPWSAYSYELPQSPWRCRACKRKVDGIARRTLKHDAIVCVKAKGVIIPHLHADAVIAATPLFRGPLAAFIRCVEIGTCIKCAVADSGSPDVDITDLLTTCADEESAYVLIDDPFWPYVQDSVFPEMRALMPPAATTAAAPAVTVPLPFTLTSQDGVLPLDCDPTQLFSRVSPANIIGVMMAILCECRILIISRDISILPDVVTTLLALIYPLESRHTVIPVAHCCMPAELFGDPMLPVIIGVHPYIAVSAGEELWAERHRQPYSLDETMAKLGVEPPFLATDCSDAGVSCRRCRTQRTGASLPVDSPKTNPDYWKRYRGILERHQEDDVPEQLDESGRFSSFASLAKSFLSSIAESPSKEDPPAIGTRHRHARTSDSESEEHGADPTSSPVIILDIDADALSENYMQMVHLLPPRLSLRLWRSILTHANMYGWHHPDVTVPLSLPALPLGISESERKAAFDVWEEMAERAENRGWDGLTTVPQDPQSLTAVHVDLGLQCHMDSQYAPSTGRQWKGCTEPKETKAEYAPPKVGRSESAPAEIQEFVRSGLHGGHSKQRSSSMKIGGMTARPVNPRGKKANKLVASLRTLDYVHSDEEDDDDEDEDDLATDEERSQPLPIAQQGSSASVALSKRYDQLAGSSSLWKRSSLLADASSGEHGSPPSEGVPVSSILLQQPAELDRSLGLDLRPIIVHPPWALWRSSVSCNQVLHQHEYQELIVQRVGSRGPAALCEHIRVQPPGLHFSRLRKDFLSVMVSLFKAVRVYIKAPAGATSSVEMGHDVHVDACRDTTGGCIAPRETSTRLRDAGMAIGISEDGEMPGRSPKERSHSDASSVLSIDSLHLSLKLGRPGVEPSAPVNPVPAGVHRHRGSTGSQHDFAGIDTGTRPRSMTLTKAHVPSSRSHMHRQSFVLGSMTMGARPYLHSPPATQSGLLLASAARSPQPSLPTRQRKLSTADDLAAVYSQPIELAPWTGSLGTRRRNVHASTLPAPPRLQQQPSADESKTESPHKEARRASGGRLSTHEEAVHTISAYRPAAYSNASNVTAGSDTSQASSSPRGLHTTRNAQLRVVVPVNDRADAEADDGLPAGMPFSMWASRAPRETSLGSELISRHRSSIAVSGHRDPMSVRSFADPHCVQHHELDAPGFADEEFIAEEVAPDVEALVRCMMGTEQFKCFLESRASSKEVDAFDRMCFRRMFLRTFRHRMLGVQAYSGILFKAIRGTLTSGFTRRLFELDGSKLTYYRNGDRIKDIENSLTQLQIEEIGSRGRATEGDEHDIATGSKLKRRISDLQRDLSELRADSKRRIFYIIPGRTQVVIPAVDSLAYPTGYVFQLVNTAIADMPQGYEDPAGLADAGPGRDILTLCAESSESRREWIVRIKSRLKVGGSESFQQALHALYLDRPDADAGGKHAE